MEKGILLFLEKNSYLQIDLDTISTSETRGVVPSIKALIEPCNVPLRGTADATNFSHLEDRDNLLQRPGDGPLLRG